MSDMFDEFEETMNRMLEQIWGIKMGRRPLLLPGDRSVERYTGGGTLFPNIRRPFIDVVETDKEVVATAEMPGLEKEEINISVTEDTLDIMAEKKREEEKQEKNYVYKERRSESFHRAINLPASVDPDNAKATYNNGILEVRMPKTEIKKKTLIKVE